MNSCFYSKIVAAAIVLFGLVGCASEHPISIVEIDSVTPLSENEMSWSRIGFRGECMPMCDPPSPKEKSCPKSKIDLRELQDTSWLAECTDDSLPDIRDQVRRMIDSILAEVDEVIDAPYKDGNEYDGLLKMCLSESGEIQKTILVKQSGHAELDEAMLNALASVGNYYVPTHICFAKQMDRLDFYVSYGDEDMRDQ